MLEQYRRIKNQHKGDILFFRLGDFYEMFAEDAVEVSALLNLTLTSRTGLPMCGVPYHAARTYIARLLKLGKKIAVCEQLTAASGKENRSKVIERDVIEVITPGTTVEEDYLEKGSSNYLCCLARGTPLHNARGTSLHDARGTSLHDARGTLPNVSGKNKLSFSYIDLCAGDFYATSFPAGETEILRQELERLQIKEMLIQESLLEEDQDIACAVHDRACLVLNRWADWLFDPAQAKQSLEKQFGIVNLKSFGLTEESPEIITAGALLDYISSTSKSLFPHIKTIKVYGQNEYVGLDEASQRNLELMANQRDGDVRFSLLEVMDETRCSMGRRLLKRRILHPLRDIDKIEKRLDMAESLYRDQGKLSRLREILGKTPDLERLCSRLAMDKAHGRDMAAIKNAINFYHEIINGLFSANGKELLFESGDVKQQPCEEDIALRELLPVYELLENGICDEPSILLNEGNLIKDGYNDELDNLRALRDNSRQILDQYLEEERGETGITSLKIRYNRLIGYFFEVTKTNLDRVPKHFIRRQGIAGGERYTTDRLAALESEINGASDKAIDLERKIFLGIREETKKALSLLFTASRRFAELDVAQSSARAASIRNWVRPQLCESGILEITEGRHPVVEAHLSRGDYIPNDIFLYAGSDISGNEVSRTPGKKQTGDKTIQDEKDQISFAMITGPNMAGKSTYLRSAALITIMAQAGSFVPATEARIGLCDRIYCRVGASDNLARGESTFLVEMNETAFILNTATNRSLVIMDEVGRGTGTNDGLSIAWAVSEELLNRVGCRTLFATHFHELSLLSHPRLANRSMEVIDHGEKIVFLRKLKEGPAAQSYGIHVAMLAGLSKNILYRASQIMAILKKRDADLSETFAKDISVNQNENMVNNEMNSLLQRELHGDVSHQSEVSRKKIDNQEINRFEEMLKEIEPEQMTPLEALNVLCQWKKLLEIPQIQKQPSEKKELKTKYHAQPKQCTPRENEPSLFD